MYIVGVAGPIGSGKSTFADYLSAAIRPSAHFESWLVIAEVANALQAQPSRPSADNIDGINEWLKVLPGVLRSVTNRRVTFDDIKLTKSRLASHPEYYEKLFAYLSMMEKNPWHDDHLITPETKEMFRSILQWLGGYLATVVDGKIWYEEITRRIALHGDLALATVGGVRFPADADVLYAAGGIVVAIERPGEEVRDLHDLTERQRSTIRTTSRVINDGTLEDLRRCANKFGSDLKRNSLHSEYRASSFAR
jgi:energy-coupling factor transporter ATP-binding protein EcfA2